MILSLILLCVAPQLQQSKAVHAYHFYRPVIVVKKKMPDSSKLLRRHSFDSSLVDMIKVSIFIIIN